MMRNHVFDSWGVRTVADCGYNTCLANVAALIRNREEGNGPIWTARTIQDDFGPLFSGSRSNVQTVPAALSYIESAIGRRKSKTFANFAEARVEGDFAIFFNDAHVVYGVIEPGFVVSVLDGNVGRGFESWQEFLTYAATNVSLYGRRPDLMNKAYRMIIDD